jgi:NADPH:quinone reductase-like Zn-dependent oxidoreductase
MNSARTPKRAFLKRRSTRIVALVVTVALVAMLFSGPAPTPPRGSGQPMQAIVYDEYGPPDVLRFEQIEKLLPEDHQVLIKVHAAAANPLDWHYMRGTPYVVRMDSGVFKPKVGRLGVDLAGRVEAVGRNVTQFKPGDEVFGTGGGAFAEYARASEKRIALKPANLSFEHAAAVPIAALTALQGLRDKGHLKPGQKVLINGASGGVGTFAVQIAKVLGAEVTGVCSTRNVEMVRSLGADHVIDYTRANFTEGTERYDLILDNVGNHPLLDYRRVMTPTGTYVLIGGGGPDAGNWIGPFVGAIKAYLLSLFVDQEFVMLLAEINQDDLGVMSEWMAARKVTPVIDQTYALSEVPDAIRYLETGRARGKVIIKVASED